MTTAKRFWVGLALALCSAAIYGWHHRDGKGPTLFDLLWHGGLLLLALALLVPRVYRTTLEFLANVLGPRAKDGAP